MLWQAVLCMLACLVLCCVLCQQSHRAVCSLSGRGESFVLVSVPVKPSCNLVSTTTNSIPACLSTCSCSLLTFAVQVSHFKQFPISPFLVQRVVVKLLWQFVWASLFFFVVVSFMSPVTDLLVHTSILDNDYIYINAVRTHDRIRDLLNRL